MMPVIHIGLLGAFHRFAKRKSNKNICPNYETKFPIDNFVRFSIIIIIRRHEILAESKILSLVLPTVNEIALSTIRYRNQLHYSGTLISIEQA